MKKLIVLIAAMLFLIPGIGFAQEVPEIPGIFEKLELKQGMAFSLADNQWNHLSTAEVINYKGFALEAGTAYDAEKTGVKGVVVVSYDLLKLKDIGVTVPILDLISLRPGIYAGVGRIGGSDEADWGLSLSCISVAF